MAKKKQGSRDPMARDLFTPKYRPRTVEGKTKVANIGRKAKHKGRPCDQPRKIIPSNWFAVGVDVPKKLRMVG